jgi:putative DNA methylase
MNNERKDLFGIEESIGVDKLARKKVPEKAIGYEPFNLGKASHLTVADFSDPGRPSVCLEVDFPIAPINALSNLEGNAGKPIYQMSKWWARRRSSVFRSLLIAAATEAPSDPSQAAKRVWDHYYCNHQKAGHFRKLRVLDIFMGGGTTLVEGARLGFQMAGVDLNPVAWFVTKNELACSDPVQVKALFEEIEEKVKPLVQPFYTTTCPRGHTGRWVDRETGKVVMNIDPAEIPPDQRGRYRWEGPEIIYTFWAKHGPCKARGCHHRTPIFRTPVIAEKKLTAYYIPVTCPFCGHEFNIELGETRMAPGVERVVLDNEPSFTETSQEFAQILKDYSKGNKEEKQDRINQALERLNTEAGLRCPKCGSFAGANVKKVLEDHRGRRLQMGNLVAYEFKAGNVKKKELGIESRHVYMYLLVHPKWLEGASGLDDGVELGGYAGADPEMTARWFEARLEGMRLVEVRGRIRLADEETTVEDEEEPVENEELTEEDADSSADRKKFGLPREIVLTDGTHIQTREGTVPEQSQFTCQKCGKKQDILESVKPTKHTAPVAAYTLQCHCPQCDADGYNYNGRFFKPIESNDVKRLIMAEREWADRNETDLNDYWPRQECWDAYMMRANGGVNVGWGYTHWWKMFNPRQLLVHTQLMRAITEAPDGRWPLDVREQALGALQQYLRNQNMFVFWNPQRDTPEPMFSNANFHPKQQTIENCVSHFLGRGNWQSSSVKVVEAMEWASEPWELVVVSEDGVKKKSEKAIPQDTVSSGAEIYCGSSTDLSMLNSTLFDLVITDPPFGNNLFYADLADFFYVWMRLPLLKWYRGMPEHKYFELERTPHAVEAVDNTVEHPDDREDHERERFLTNGILTTVRELTGNKELGEKAPNPLYRPEPASDFYQQTLTTCWAEAGRLLKQGGLMAFTFHHSADAPWVDVLEALFNAGYLLVATYPIRSDETKGATGAFGSRKIEYDIIHVCRKRLEEPKAVSWARMRRWVKEEASQLKELLEHSHGKELPESDLLVILRGKALEFYSRHYGQVFTGDGQLLGVRDALLGINLLLDDLLAGKDENGKRRPPDVAEPKSRLFLRVFQSSRSMARDELHKTLRGTGVSQGDIEAQGWIRVVGTSVFVIPIEERFQYFKAPGRNRKVLKTDLDQAHFLIGAAMPGSGVDVSDELNRATFQIKRSVDPILDWYAQTDPDTGIRRAAKLALDLVSHWRAKPDKGPEFSQRTLFEQLEAEVE